MSHGLSRFCMRAFAHRTTHIFLIKQRKVSIFSLKDDKSNEQWLVVDVIWCSTFDFSLPECVYCDLYQY